LFRRVDAARRTRKPTSPSFHPFCSPTFQNAVRVMDVRERRCLPHFASLRRRPGSPPNSLYASPPPPLGFSVSFFFSLRELCGELLATPAPFFGFFALETDTSLRLTSPAAPRPQKPDTTIVTVKSFSRKGSRGHAFGP